MQALECTASADAVYITIERKALSTALVAQVNEYLRELLSTPEQSAPITANSPSASELRRLPPDERRRIMAEQFANAAVMYAENPDAIVEDTSDWSDVYANHY